MKYIVEKNNNNLKLTYYSSNLIGLNVTPKGNTDNYTIKAKKIIIVDKELIDNYIKEKINRKLDKIIEFMIKLLNDEDTSDEDTEMILGEVERLKTIIMNKYKEYLKEKEYKTLLTKLILIEEEFKKNYNQKLFASFYNSNRYIVDDYVSGRSM